MSARILNGTEIADQIKSELAEEVSRLRDLGVRPGLAAVLVGNTPASEIYVRSKVKTCEALGLLGETITRPASVTTEELLELVGQLNRRDEIDGILVQLPLPKQVDTNAVLMAISPQKDVDGLHPLNFGRLAERLDTMLPCTPAGVMEILRRSEIPLAGAEAVMVGRSNIVGKPTAMLLTYADATVTVCHSKTRNLAQVCRRADVLVVATGRPGLITTEHVKPGATVVDVGMNRIESREEFDRLFRNDAKKEAAFAKNGYIVTGDVRPEVAEVAGAITPVPGGVGPLTIAMLMVNTVKAARLRRGTRVPAASGKRG
ncbi:MAG: bifunctional 5,10-methylenetetrahydrofolate dehydrogenase/5,10-methenyltetrahydrofolate cyclohydrolase [Acidobacteriia bacterium]|nr:bifunctional 5,10-methylenetetrahydrofolate dehydrogenase/5,10-methenyltetrahydrofolate cyclohydrolase [Terriglobia bacterium]